MSTSWANFLHSSWNIRAGASVIYFVCKNQFFKSSLIFLKICFTSRSIFSHNFYKMAASFSFQTKVEKWNGKWKSHSCNWIETNQNKLQNKSTHIAVLFTSNLVKVVWQLVTYPERFRDIISFWNKEGRLMVMCLVQRIDLYPFHQAVHTNTIQLLYTGTRTDSSEEEPEEEIWFSVEEGNITRSPRKKMVTWVRLKTKIFLRSPRIVNNWLKSLMIQINYQIQETCNVNFNVK